MRPKTEKPLLPPRPFPWRCRECGKIAVMLAKSDYQAEVRHDGKLYAFSIPDFETPTCNECGTRVFTETVDEQINDALRVHLGLLTPVQLREAIERVGLSQKALAEHLAIAEATVSRWLGGSQIQSRAMDRLLRIFFAFTEVRQVLLGREVELDRLGLDDITRNPSIATNAAGVGGRGVLSNAPNGGGNWNGTRERCRLAQNHVRTLRSMWSESVG